MQDSRLVAALHWIADRTVIGGLVLVGSLLLVTAPAAFAAGAAATKTATLGEAVPAFVQQYRSSVRPAVLPGLLVIALALSAAGSLLVVAPMTSGLVRAVFLLAGLLAAAASVLLLTFSASSLVTRGGVQLPEVAARVLAIPRSIPALLGAALLLVASLGLLPVLALPLSGLLAQLIVALGAPAAHTHAADDARLDRRQPDARTSELGRS